MADTMTIVQVEQQVSEDTRNTPTGEPELDAEIAEAINKFSSAEVDNYEKGKILASLAYAMQPRQLRTCAEGVKEVLIKNVTEKGIVDNAIRMVDECEEIKVAEDATIFLASFVIAHPDSSQMVLAIIPRLVRRFKAMCTDLCNHLRLVESALLLCVNVAATYPAAHSHLVQVVDVVSLQILGNPKASEYLHSNSVTLLANLADSVRDELRSLDLFEVLIELAVDGDISDTRKSVVESVIIYLYGHEKCDEVDELMDLNVIDDYCVPLLDNTLKKQRFRGMWPAFEYSARVFEVLAQCPDYAQLLVKNEKVIPLVLQAAQKVEVSFSETDFVGCGLALETLWSLASFGFWPSASADSESIAFCEDLLPRLTSHSHCEVRRSAAGLWACLNKEYIKEVLLVGKHLEAQRGLPPMLWGFSIMPYLFPVHKRFNPKLSLMIDSL